VYANKIPSLYINGNFVKMGKASTKTNVYPSLGTGIYNTSLPLYSYFNGALDNVRIWNGIRTEAQIRTDMYRDVPSITTSPSLGALYTFDGSNLNATSPYGSNLSVPSGATAPSYADANYYSYTWTTTGGTTPTSSPVTSPTTSVAVTNSGTSNVTYTYKVSATAGSCSGTLSSGADIVISPSLGTPANITLSQCSGTSYTFNATLTAGTGGDQIEFADNTSFTSSTVLTSPYAASTVVASGTTALYYYRTRNSVTGCVGSGYGTISLTVTPTPATPGVSVVNSCGTSTLTATGTTGTLLWSTGETTTSITVGTAGARTVTQTVGGCPSAAGSGTAAPTAIPATPGVSVVNSCGSSTLTATGTTGTLLWSTGATTTSITVATAGARTVTQTVGGCASAAGSGTAAPLTIPAAPGVTVTNSCGSSTLTATGFAGSLLWSTGETTTSITVSTAGARTVTQTVGTCTSLAGSGTAAPNTVPATPGVTVVNSCGSSTLTATGFTGSLLWSTGETTTSITVATAGARTVTQTVGGCTSLAGSGTAAPNAVPATPGVSVVNNCGTSTLTATGTTGTLLWSTGETTTSITVSTAGARTVTQTIGTCTSLAGSGTAAPNAVPATPGVSVVNNCGTSTLTATGTTGTLLWSTGETTTSITVSTAGARTVTQTIGTCTSLAGSGTAAPLTVPATPGVSVTNNCGSSTLTATGTTGTLLWSTGATTTSITVASAGARTVTQTIGSCTSLPGSGTAAPIAIPATPGVSVANNCGTSTLTATGTTGTLLWSTGETTTSITVGTAGVRTVTQTVGGCPSAAGSGTAAPLTVPATPGVTVVNSCGSSTLTATGTTGTLLWSTGETTTSITVTTAGVRTVTQTVGGCASAAGSGTAAPLTVPATPGVTVTNNCGSSTLTATGTTGTLLWSTGETTTSITVATAGARTVTQTVGSCTSAAGSGTAAPTIIPAPGVNVSNSCGSSTLTATGYSGTLLWSTGETTASITVTTAGARTVTQTFSGCTSPSGSGTAAPLAVPAAPTVSVTQPTCASANGSVAITSTTSGLTFSTDGTNYAAYTTPYTVAANASYSLTAKNGSNCVSSTTTGTMGPQPTPPTIPVASVTVQPTCAVTSGTIVVSSPTGAVYEYSLDAGAYQASATFTGVASGNHTVKARLAASPSCISSESSTLTVNAFQAPIAPIPTVNICQGGSGNLVAVNNCENNYLVPSNPNSIYGGWASGGTPIADRPVSSANNTATCAFQTGVTRNYHEIPFQVSVTGNYTFVMNDNAAYDGMGYIYTGSFTPGSCGSGTLLRMDNDNGGSAGAEPTLGPIALTAGTTYFIVSTTNGSTGTLVSYDYTWTVTPPSGGDILLNAPGAVQWYDAASGGTLLGTGLTFNPVGVDPALPNTNTNGTHTYYAACSSSPDCRTQADFNITTSETIYNVTPANSSTCYDASVPVSVGLSNSTNGFTYKLFRDGVYTGISNTGNGGAVAIGNTTVAGTYTVQLQTGGCDIPMSGSVVIKPLPIAYAGTDVQLPCSGGLTLTGSSNSTTIATLDFGTSVSTQLSSTVNSGWKLKYLYGTEPANRTEWWISHNGATPYPDYDQPGNSFPLSGSSSALMLIDHRIYQTVVGADYAWDAGTTDEIAYNTAAVDARLYTSVNLAFDYRIGGTFSGSNVYDYLQVVYSLDNGTTWTAVNAGNAGGSFTLNRQMSGTTNAFFSRTANTPATGTANVSIPAVAGLQFLLGFRWVNDGSLTGAFVGGPVIDNINVTGGASYSWSPTSGVSGATTATPTVTQAGTYTVVVTAGNNCTASDQVIVATPNVPTISLTSAANSDNQTTCPSVSITDITYAVGGSATGAGVSGLPSGVTGSYSAGVFTITGTPSVLGTYNYTVTTTGSACPAATANGIINVTASSSYGTVVSGDQVICGGSGTPDPVSVTGATGTYQWYVYNGVASSCPTGTTIPVGWSSLGSTNGANTATYNPASISASKTYACLVTASCGSPTWASGCRTVTVDPVFTRDVVEEPCMSMSEATSITVGNINYSYFNVTATGGTSPYTFPADNAPTLKRVGTITTGVAYAYEMDATVSDIFVVTDALGCQAGSSVVNPSYTSQPTEIAVSSGIGAEAQSCHDYGYNRWVTYLNDNAGINEAIMSINSYGNNLGLVTVNMYRDADEAVVTNSAWSGYACPGSWMRPMERHFMVTTSNAPGTAQGQWGTLNKVGVRLYFTNEELTDLIKETYSFNGVPGSSNFGNDCNANDDVTNINDLYVTKYTAPPGSLNTENGQYDDNIATQNNPSAIYRLFGDNTTPALGNGPLRKDRFTNNSPVNFDGIYGRSTPSVSGVPQPHHFVELDVEEFSEFWLHGTSHITPLPVEMIYLEANAVNNAFIHLKWATALEVNNDGFQIERSTDGQTWATIGWVNGNDNATTQTNYTFDDVNVVANTVYYYRLKQVDNDGAFEYTDIVSARITGEVSFSVKDFVPNPTMDKTNLIITASKDQDITVTFYNVVGQKVLESTHQVSKGGTRLEFELGKLASGTYTAIVSSANDVYTKKVVLAR
jgi:hypothetical protein